MIVLMKGIINSSEPELAKTLYQWFLTWGPWYPRESREGYTGEQQTSKWIGLIFKKS